MANIRDLAVSEVATPPSPATTGTSLTLRAGGGAYMPPVPFKALAFPKGVLPDKSNSEKVLVTAITTDTVTIERAQGETTAQPIGEGWIFSNSIFTEDITSKLNKTGDTMTGHLGIGGAPSEVLHVKGGNVQGARIESTGNAPVVDLYSAGPRNYRITANYNVGGNFELLRSTASGGAPTTSVLMADGTNGYIAVGKITAPASMLDVNGTVTAASFNGDGSSLTGIEQDKSYIYTFTSLATVTVTHNLGKRPAVTVVDSAENEVEGDIKYTNLNELTVSFSAPFSGTIILN